MSTAITIQPQASLSTSAPLDPFEPQSWSELMELATMISKTDFAPRDFKGKPEACAIAMMYGRQLGIGGLQAIQNIAVINGKPSVYGDLFWAIITSHPDFVDCVEEVTDTQATCTLTRRGQTPKTVTFSQADAVKAGLWGKAGPWTQYPKIQMQWRARTFAGRFLFADALKGLTSSHEAQDYTAGPTIDGNTRKKAAPAPEPSPTTPPTSGTISKKESKDFWDACKASGFTLDEAKSSLNSICGVTASLAIPSDKFEAVMQWSTKNPSWPHALDPNIRNEELCRELFGILGYDLAKQAEAIEAHGSEWSALLTHLNSELPVE